MKRKLLTNILILICLLLLSDRILGSCLKYFYFKERSGDSHITTYAIKEAKEDLLIFGSSRANHHYIPTVIEDSLGISAYNLGRDGMDINYSNILLQSVVARHVPGVVILDIGPEELSESNGTRNSLAILTSCLLPYASDYPIIRKELKTINPREVLKSDVSLLYRFNSLILSVFQHHLKLGNKDFKGYKPLYATMTDAMLKHNQKVLLPMDDRKLKSYERFLQICRTQNVRLFITISPNRNHLQTNSTHHAREIASTYGYSVWDYSASPLFDDNQLFQDPDHLNNVGAQYYTSLIIQRMKTAMKTDI